MTDAEDVSPIPSTNQPAWVDQEDARKLHAEINQISNQRVILTTFSISVFLTGNATVISHMPKVPSDFALIEVFSILIEIFLFTICYLSNAIRDVSRCEATFLIAKGHTNWEMPWRIFRSKRHYSGLSTAQNVIFYTLMASQSVFHFIIYQISPLLILRTFDVFEKFLFLSPVVVGIFLLLGISLNHYLYGPRETSAESSWKNILAANKTQTN